MLEAYFVTTCDDYPTDGQIIFRNVTLLNQYLRPVPDPKWSVAVDLTDTPQCSYGVRSRPTQVTLDY